MRQWLLSLVIESTNGKRALYEFPVYAESIHKMNEYATRHAKATESEAVTVESYSFSEIVPANPMLFSQDQKNPQVPQVPRLQPLEPVRGSMILKAEEKSYSDLNDFIKEAYENDTHMFAQSNIVSSIELELEKEPMLEHQKMSWSFWKWVWKKFSCCAQCSTAKRRNTSVYEPLSQEEMQFLNEFD